MRLEGLQEFDLKKKLPWKYEMDLIVAENFKSDDQRDCGGRHWSIFLRLKV